MSIRNIVSPRNIELLKLWTPTLATFGATATAAMLYVTDWKLVLQYVPIYNTKWRKD